MPIDKSAFVIDWTNSTYDFFTSGSLKVGYNSNSATVNGTSVTGKIASWVDNGNPTTGEIGFGRAENTTSSIGATIYGARSRGTLASKAIVQNGDNLLDIIALGYDGTDYAIAGKIKFEVDGTPGNNDMPTRIVFEVSPDGSHNVAEGLRISNDKSVKISGAYTMPNADGSSGQILSTNGSGTVSWATAGQPLTGYTLTNVSTDKALDADVTTLDEVADVLGTLIDDLQNGYSGSSRETYETVSKNLKVYDGVITYSGDAIDYITYDLGGGLSIVKTLNYTAGVLTSIVLSGDTPSGIDLTKTLSYTSGKLTGFTYS